MPKTYPFIQIRFIQKNVKASEDHHLDIKRSDGGYLWVYRAPDLDQTETITLKNREEVFERLEILADLLGIDEDPMLSFQVFIPGMPTVLASIRRFQASLGLIQRAIDATIERWAIRAPWEEVNGRLDQDNCHDVDSVYSEDEEDDESYDTDEESEHEEDEDTDKEQADPAPDRLSSWVAFVTAWHNMMPEGTPFTESMRQAGKAWRALRGESQAREDGELSDSTDSDSTDSEMPPLVSHTPARNCGSLCCPVAPRRRAAHEDPEGAGDRAIRMTRNGPRVHLRF